MKRIGLGLSLSFLALSLLASSALAASSPRALQARSAADRAFLASLASVRAPAPAPLAKHPRTGPRTGSGTVQGKALCTASATCRDGSTVSCEGNNSSASCTAVDSQCPWGEQGHVTCDGVTTWCPACPFNCSQAEDSCYRGCYPCSFTFTCDESGPSCDCNWSTCPQ
jgi:hypothetical protein